MKKKVIITVLVVLLAVLLGTLGIICWQIRKTCIWHDSELIRRDLAEITLSEEGLPSPELLSQLPDLQRIDARNFPLTIEQYEQLKKDAPQAAILWRVPFQGSYLEEDTEYLCVSSLSESDFPALGYLPKLKFVDAEGCEDYSTVVALKEAHPQLDIQYSINLSGTPYSPEIQALALADADIGELQAALPYLTQLRSLTFTGATPENEDIYQLALQYPDIEFHWNFTLLGVETSDSATMLDLSGIPMESTEEIESHLKYFKNLERVEMCDCGIPNEEMDAMAKRHPEIKFVWTVRIGKGKLRTDATAFIPYKLGYHFNNRLTDEQCTELKYCTDLICLDMGHMNITDLSFLRYMPKMKYLIVADTLVTDFSPIAELKELIYLEIFNVRLRDTEFLKDLTKLEDLNICSTQVDSAEVLKQMTWLKRLWLVATHLNSNQQAEISNTLVDTQVVFYAQHSTAGGWREHQNYRDMRDLLGMWYMH